ncbi:YqiA/YcfP family alpha/beta fold hydrolase [Caminibacter sp.]
MIVYIHGFASCGNSNKTKMLKRYFQEVISPDLPPSPKETLKLLERYIKADTTLIGSSLGGFYAMYLAEKYGLKAVLINPSLKPYKTLKKYTGIQYRYCDNKPFEWKKHYLKELKKLKVKPKRGKYLVLLQSGDEILNYKKALKKFKDKPNAKVVVEYGGNHRFENLDEYLCMIEKFIQH